MPKIRAIWYSVKSLSVAVHDACGPVLTHWAVVIPTYAKIGYHFYSLSHEFKYLCIVVACLANSLAS